MSIFYSQKPGPTTTSGSSIPTAHVTSHSQFSATRATIRGRRVTSANPSWSTSYVGGDLGVLMRRKPVSLLLAVTLTLAAAWTAVVVSLLLVSAVQATAACLGALGAFAKQLVMASLAIIALGLTLVVTLVAGLLFVTSYLRGTPSPMDTHISSINTPTVSTPHATPATPRFLALNIGLVSVSASSLWLRESFGHAYMCRGGVDFGLLICALTAVVLTCSWIVVVMFLINTEIIGNCVLHSVFHNDCRSLRLLVALFRGSITSSCQVQLDRSLHISATKQNLQSTKILLEIGADPNCVEGSELISPLMRASRQGIDACLDALLAYGAKVNQRDSSGSTSLAVAARWNKLECLGKLLKAGADPTIPDRSGKTPLMIAVEMSHMAVMDMLLKHKSNNATSINASDNLRRTALHLAVMGVDEEYLSIPDLQLQLPHDEDYEGDDGGDGIARHEDEDETRNQRRGRFVMGRDAREGGGAAIGGEHSGHAHFDVVGGTTTGRSRGLQRVRMVKRLIQAGASVHSKDYLNETPLHTSCKGGWARCDVINALLDSGADADARNYARRCPLHLAAAIQGISNSQAPADLRCSAALLARGASVHTKDRDGRTPGDCAVAQGRLALVLEYMHAGYSPSEEALDVVVASGNLRLATALVDAGCAISDGNRRRLLRLTEDFCEAEENRQRSSHAEYLRHRCKHPFTLKHLCHIAVRRNLNYRDIGSQVSDLDIPHCLKTYLKQVANFDKYNI